MKKIASGLSGLVLGLSLIAAITFTGCSSGPAVPASHYTNGTLNTSYNNCLDCHKTGTNGAPQEPASHANYTNDRCLKCHKSP